MNTKSFVKELIPPVLLKIKHRLLNKSQINKPLFENLTKRNIKFKNIHKGERVFILATGPSIQTQDLKPLKNENCIAVSHFHLHEDIQIINPKYHVLAPQHPPFNFNDSSKYFFDFKKAYAKSDTHIFLGINDFKYSYLELLKAKPELVVPNIHYIDYSTNYQLDEQNLYNADIWDITKVLFGMRTVVYGAIQIAYYMGFSEIYLLGCDHDYLFDLARTKNQRFYKDEIGISDNDHLKQISLEAGFLDYYLRWKQYRLMKEFFNNKNIKIYNATNGGILDVFQRIDLSELVS